MTRPTDTDLRNIVRDRELMSDDNPRRNETLLSIARELLELRTVRDRFACLAAHLGHVGPCGSCGDWAQEIRDRLAPCTCTPDRLCPEHVP